MLGRASASPMCRRRRSCASRPEIRRKGPVVGTAGHQWRREAAAAGRAGTAARGGWCERALANRSDSRRIRIISDADGLVVRVEVCASSSAGTPMRDANSGSSGPTVRAAPGRDGPPRRVRWPPGGRGSGPAPRPAPWKCRTAARFQHFFDLARGAAVGVALDRDDDALPDRRCRHLPARHGSPRSARTPPAGRRCGGVPAARCGACPLASVRLPTSPRLLQHRYRHGQAALPDLCPVCLRIGPGIHRRPSDGCGSARRRTNWVATHCFLGD